MEAYYRLLKEKFPTRLQVLTEIINLDAICHLPKGTEYFLSDLHGEYFVFDYLLRNGSGAIKRKVEQCFQDKSQGDINQLCKFIYYPEEMLAIIASEDPQSYQEQLLKWLPDLLHLIKYIGSKYTQSKIRKMMPKSFSYIIEELLSEMQNGRDKVNYVAAIINRFVSLGQIDRLLVELAYLVQKLTIDHLHIVGDIFDRGSYPDKIIDRLMDFKKVDIQWGNHDITWMGAVSGSYVCMINVIRIAARYNNLSLIEDSYGINLRELVQYSLSNYQPVPAFDPILDGNTILDNERYILNVLQQATAILQFKLERQLIKRRPEFQLERRDIFSAIDFQNNQFITEKETVPLKDFNTICLDIEHPELLSAEEDEILRGLMYRFQHSERLQKQVNFLFDKGAMYLISNNHLLFHGCIPMHANGDFKSFRYHGKNYAGKTLLDFYEKKLRKSYQTPEKHTDFETDLFWYLWVGEISSLFGKEQMATFERYYVEDKTYHVETKNPYYHLRDKEEICKLILADFGLDSSAHIVNGHTPVREKEGENPIKGNGRLIIIDGGMAKGYQEKTGIAGYTLISNSHGLELIAHHPFISKEHVLESDSCTTFTKRLVEGVPKRILVSQTDKGKKFLANIKDLEHLYMHFNDY